MSASDLPPPHRVPRVVSVRRTGGFMGRTVEGVLDLHDGDPRAEEAAAIVAGLDRAAVRAGRPHPDMYSYEFDLGDGSAPLTAPEHLLPADLRRLATLLLASA